MLLADVNIFTHFTKFKTVFVLGMRLSAKILMCHAPSRAGTCTLVRNQQVHKEDTPVFKNVRGHHTIFKTTHSDGLTPRFTCPRIVERCVWSFGSFDLSLPTFAHTQHLICIALPELTRDFRAMLTLHQRPETCSSFAEKKKTPLAFSAMLTLPRPATLCPAFLFSDFFANFILPFQFFFSPKKKNTTIIEVRIRILIIEVFQQFCSVFFKKKSISRNLF